MLTEWPEIRATDPEVLAKTVARRVIVDARHALDPALWRGCGWDYRAPGRPGHPLGGPARDGDIFTGSALNQNEYLFTADNPINRTDPTGHNLCDFIVGGLFGAIGIAAGFALAPTVVGSILVGGFIVFGGILATNAVC